ncbi:MAG TPA: thiamine phosphate synthase [Paenibacillus sp.]
MREYLQLYLVVGSANCKDDPVKVVREALEGGVTLVQFREKGPGSLTGAVKLELAERLRALCHSAGALFIVNDDVELALAVDADGVHIGQEDEEADRVRARIGERILGVSAITAEEARSAIRQGADYLGIGPIYPTSSKEDARAVQGPQVLKKLRTQGITLPMVGIGGITAERAAEVVSAGADGVAVISAITQADNARNAAAALKSEVLRALASSSSATQGSEV